MQIEIMRYQNREDLLTVRDYRCKLLFDLADYPEVRRHFRKLAAFATPTLMDLKKCAPNAENLSEVFNVSLCKCWKG